MILEQALEGRLKELETLKQEQRQALKEKALELDAKRKQLDAAKKKVRPDSYSSCLCIRRMIAALSETLLPLLLLLLLSARFPFDRFNCTCTSAVSCTR